MKHDNNTTTQVDVCYAILRKLIIRCEIAPGARLTEKELIAKLGFGRTPVREALLRLDHDRLVDTLPRSGYRVRQLTHKSIDDFFIAWRAVAPLLVRLAYERMDAATRRKIAALADTQEALVRGDSDGNSRIASQLFGLFAAAADSEYLTFIYNRFGAEMDRLFRIFFATPEGQIWLDGHSRMRALATLDQPEIAADRISHALKIAHRNILAIADRYDREGWPFAHVATPPAPPKRRKAAATPKPARAVPKRPAAAKAQAAPKPRSGR